MINKKKIIIAVCILIATVLIIWFFSNRKKKKADDKLKADLQQDATKLANDLTADALTFQIWCNLNKETNLTLSGTWDKPTKDAWTDYSQEFLRA